MIRFCAALVLCAVACGGGARPMAAADGGCPAGYAGCVSFADATGPAASRVITFRDYEYTPKCLRVRAGQSVTFQGDFVVHPLRTSCAPERVLLESSGTSTTFTMRLPGFYGYYCLDHGNEIGQAMAGAVEVVP